MKWYQMLHRAEKKPSEAGFTGDVERAKRESRFSFQSRGAGKTGEAGFTLLLAALVGSIVLAIGSSIFVIAQKQLILSSIGRESQFAFYAADTGAECALYWDIRHDSFGAEGPSGVLRCDSQSLNVELIDGTWNDPSHAAQFEFDLFADLGDRKSTRLNSSHSSISYAVFCLKTNITVHYDDCTKLWWRIHLGFPSSKLAA